MGIFLTVLPLAVGGTAAVLTMDAMAQYSALPQPPLAPPAWVFPAVWTVLYLLMGAASRRVYRLGTQESRNALMLYYVQLAAHFVWPLLYFRAQEYAVAFWWLLLLLALVFWLTLSGANTVSAMLSGFLLGLEAPLRRALVLLSLPPSAVSLLTDGVWRVLATVVSVMLPRGRRLSAAHRASAGSCVLPRRRLRQAEPKHVLARAACAKKQNRMRFPILLKAIFRFLCPA